MSVQYGAAARRWVAEQKPMVKKDRLWFYEKCWLSLAHSWRQNHNLFLHFVFEWIKQTRYNKVINIFFNLWDRSSLHISPFLVFTLSWAAAASSFIYFSPHRQESGMRANYWHVISNSWWQCHIGSIFSKINKMRSERGVVASRSSTKEPKSHQ